MDQGKSFWKRPEGITGMLFLAGILLGGGYLLYQSLPLLISLAANTLYLAGMLAALGVILYVVLDPKARNLVWYMYKSVMRWITGIFVKIDPISILKSYMEDLEDNLRKLSKQIGLLRAQMRQLRGTMDGNRKEIERNLKLAEQARNQNDEKNLTLATRKAGRLQDANDKYDVLFRKMDTLYKVLTKMYENSEIVLEDTRDQITVKEQEYKAIKAGHGAIQSAMSILSGNPDQRARFDQALEAMAEEVSQKVGEMERFMDTSRNLMDSIDLQSGVFEDEGMRMLEELEKNNPMGGKTQKPPDNLDINTPPPIVQKEKGNDYRKLFD